MSMTRSKAIGIRVFLDDLISAIPTTNEAAWNAAAAEINTKAAAIRVWLPGTEDKPREYARGAIRTDPADNVPYWAIHAHTSYAGAELQPSLTPSIWTHCHGTTKENARPFVAEGHNPYMEGHYCIENGVAYRCKMNNTVHAPSVFAQAWEVAV